MERGTLMAANKGSGPQKGSGGQRRRGLRGRGPTPKAEDRVYHAAYRAKQAAQQRARTSRRPTPAGADWVVGRNPVLEALLAGLPVKTAYVAEGAERDDRLREIFRFSADHSLPMLQVTRAELDRMTGGATHQGVALQLRSYEYHHPDDLLVGSPDSDAAPLIVALDGITDPQNLGAIIRSAAAFGASGVVIPERRSASLTAVAWKASAGAAARVPVAMATNLNRALESYAKAGFTIVGLAGEAETDIGAVPGVDGPLVLVVGSEGDGLSRLARTKCDTLAAIPITSAVESLNASVATAIALYEVMRCRG